MGNRLGPKERDRYWGEADLWEWSFREACVFYQFKMFKVFRHPCSFRRGIKFYIFYLKFSVKAAQIDGLGVL